MTDGETGFAWGFWVGIAIATVIGLSLAVAVRNHVRATAIEGGHAHYAVDPKTGDVRFEWIPRTAEAKP